MRVSAAHILSMPPLDLDFKQGIRNVRVYNTTQLSQGKQQGYTRTHNTLHVCSSETSAPCSPSRLRLRTALVLWCFIFKRTLVSDLCCRLAPLFDYK